jgi:hypothetical protein
MSPLFRSLFLTFCLLMAFTISNASAEEEVPEESRSIAGDITLILASAEPAHIDRQLLPMKEDLYRAFAPKFQRFEYIQASYPRLVLGNPHAIRLPGGGRMKMTYLGMEGGYLRLRIELPEWTGMIRVKDGKRFFQAGRKLRKGILVISTRMHATQ